MGESQVVDNFSRFLDCAARVASYIRRRVRNADLAAEIFQEVSLLVLTHSGVPTDNQTFDAWCCGVARNTVSHHFRAQRRQAALLSRAELEAPSLLAQAPHDPEHDVAVRQLLGRVLANVDEGSRDLMLERYLIGRSAEELAESRAQSSSAVRMRLMRLRAAAQKEAGIADEAFIGEACDLQIYAESRRKS